MRKRSARSDPHEQMARAGKHWPLVDRTERDVLTAQSMRAVAERLYRDGGQAELVHSKGDRTVWRTLLDEETTVIVKLWSRSDVRSVVRRLTRTSSAVREFRTLRRLQRAVVPVPAPMGYCFLSASGVPQAEALFLEDLGECMSGMKYICEHLATVGSSPPVSKAVIPAEAGCRMNHRMLVDAS